MGIGRRGRSARRRPCAQSVAPARPGSRSHRNPKPPGRRRCAIKRIDAVAKFMSGARRAFRQAALLGQGVHRHQAAERHAATSLNVIGRGVVRGRPSSRRRSRITRTSSVRYIRAKHGAARRSISTRPTEVFVPLKGQWGIYWQNKNGTKHEVVLDPMTRSRCRSAVARLPLSRQGRADASDRRRHRPGRVHWPKENRRGSKEARLRAQKRPICRAIPSE